MVGECLRRRGRRDSTDWFRRSRWSAMQADCGAHVSNSQEHEASRNSTAHASQIPDQQEPFHWAGATPRKARSDITPKERKEGLRHSWGPFCRGALKLTVKRRPGSLRQQLVVLLLRREQCVPWVRARGYDHVGSRRSCLFSDRADAAETGLATRK